MHQKTHSFSALSRSFFLNFLFYFYVSQIKNKNRSHFPWNSLYIFFCQGDFQGNFDRSTIVAHDILATGMIFRIYPKSWYTQPSLRLELYGCSLGNSLKSWRWHRSPTHPSTPITLKIEFKPTYSFFCKFALGKLSIEWEILWNICRMKVIC